MMERPRNHVTERHLLPADIANGRPCPELSEPLLQWLEAAYPPLCLGVNQSVEDHLRYAGKVELVAGLRAQLKRYQDEEEPEGE